MRILLSLSIVYLALTSCGIKGNGNVKDFKRSVQPFEAIEVGGTFEVTLVQGDFAPIEIKADENLHPVIKTSVKKEKLVVESEKPIRNAEALELVIAVPDLKSLELGGASEVRSDGKLETKKLRIDAGGAAEVELTIDCKNLDGRFSGASDVNLTGKAKKAQIRSSGASELSLENLEIQEAELRASGASEIDINVSRRLSVKASGSADIRYSGTPELAKSEISGAASVNSDN